MGTAVAAGVAVVRQEATVEVEAASARHPCQQTDHSVYVLGVAAPRLRLELGLLPESLVEWQDYAKIQ